MGTLWCLTLLLVLSAHAQKAPNLTITPMIAGVTTRLQGQVYREGTKLGLYLFWTRPTKMHMNYECLWTEARQTIRQLGKHVDAPTLNHFQRRLNRIAPPKPKTAEKNKKREKRGLFNFVCELSASLFGTAMEEDQVREIQEALLTVDEKVHQIGVIADELVIAVNQTRNYQITLPDQLNKVIKRVNELQKEYLKAITETRESVKQTRVILGMELTLSELETIHAMAQQEELRQQRALQSAEAGHLTEDMLSREDLQAILLKHSGIYAPMEFGGIIFTHK